MVLRCLRPQALSETSPRCDCLRPLLQPALFGCRSCSVIIFRPLARKSRLRSPGCTPQRIQTARSVPVSLRMRWSSLSGSPTSMSTLGLVSGRCWERWHSKPTSPIPAPIRPLPRLSSSNFPLSSIPSCLSFCRLDARRTSSSSRAPWVISHRTRRLQRS